MTLITYGRMVPLCLEIADDLSRSQGIEIEIIDPRTLRPLDMAPIVASASKTGRVLIVHEAVQFGGFGGELAAQIADSDAFFYLDGPIKRLGGLDIPIPYNPNLEKHAVPTPERIRETILGMLR